MFQSKALIFSRHVNAAWLLIIKLGLPAVLAIFLGSISVFANEDDDKAPLTIKAQQAELSGLDHTTTYSGDVVMEKGSMSIDADTVVFRELEGTTTYSGNVVVIMEVDSARIEADQVIIHNNKRQISKITALGKPARYQQVPRGQSHLVVAKANTLEYQLENETLHLIENASLEQDGSSLSGNRIDYDLRDSVVKAGSSVDQKERVHMIIPSKALKSGTNDEADTPQSNEPSASDTGDTRNANATPSLEKKPDQTNSPSE